MQERSLADDIRFHHCHSSRITRHAGKLHSHLSDTIGSVFAARRAGKYEASSATRQRSAETQTNVSGSFGWTPYNKDERKRVTMSAPVRPTITPPAIRNV